MKYIYFAVIDSYEYHAITDVRYKNYVDFIIHQWGEEELTKQLNNYLQGHIVYLDDIDSYSFFGDYYGYEIYWIAIDSNDNRLKDTEDPNVTFREFVKTHCANVKEREVKYSTNYGDGRQYILISVPSLNFTQLYSFNVNDNFLQYTDIELSEISKDLWDPKWNTIKRILTDIIFDNISEVPITKEQMISEMRIEYIGRCINCNKE